MATPKLITLGDLLKSEADPNSREAIAAPAETKIGQLVKHPIRRKWLVALSDAENGKVLVQAHNCVINLDYVAQTAITSVQSSDEAPLTVEGFIAEGDAYGIKYIGTPYTV